MKFSDRLEAKFETMLARYPVKRSALVPMLLFAQDEVGCLNAEVVAEISRRLDLTVLEVEGVIGYYSMLRRQPAGKHHIQVCTNISCMLRDAYPLWEHVQRRLGLKNKEVSADGLFSLEEVECMGACGWAPAIQVNYDFYHHMTPEKFDALVEKLRKGAPPEAEPRADARALSGPAV